MGQTLIPKNVFNISPLKVSITMSSKRPLLSLLYTPPDKVHYMWHKGTWISIKRSQTPGDMWNRKGDERLILTLEVFYLVVVVQRHLLLFLGSLAGEYLHWTNCSLKPKSAINATQREG